MKNMKKLILLSLLIYLGSLISYGQSPTAKFTGETKVCPNRAYTYVFKANQAVDATTKVTVFVEGGTFVNSNNMNIADYYIQKGQTSFEFQIQWDDNPIPNGRISTLTFGYPYLGNISVISLKGVSVNNIQSSPIRVNNGVIEIPYGQTGALTLTTSANYPYMSENTYSITNFEWNLAGNTTRGNGTYTINYGPTNLDGDIVSVTPIGYICNEVLGIPSTITIKRTLNVNIISNSGNVVCENSMISFSAIGVPNGASINWIAGNNFTLVSGQNTTNAIFRANGNGQGVVKAQLSIAGASSIVENNKVWVGVPNESAGEITNFEANGMEFVCGSVYLFSVYPKEGTEYIWTVEGGRILTDRPSDDQNSYVYIETNMVRPKSKLYFSLSAQTKNTCGLGPATVRQGNVIFGDPVTLSVKRELNDESIIKSSPSILNYKEIVKIKVYLLTGILISSENVNSGFDIKSLNLQNGIYILETTDNDGNIKREKILISK